MIKKIVIAQLFFLIVASSALYAQTFEWARKAGGSSSDYNQFVQQDSQGNVYTLGYSSSGTILGDRYVRTNSHHIIKYSSTGEIVWTKLMPTESYVYFRNFIIDDHDNLFVAISNIQQLRIERDTLNFGENNSCILKFNTQGELVSKQSYECQLCRIDVKDNHIFIAGRFYRQLILGNYKLTSQNVHNYSTSFFIAKSDLNGNIAFATSMEGDYKDDSDLNINASADGTIYLTGRIGYGNLVYKNQALPKARFSGAMFAASFQSNGDFNWIKYMGGNNCTLIPVEIKSDNDNNIIIAGRSYGDIDGISSGFQNIDGSFVMKINPSGRQVWQHSLESIVTGFMPLNGCALAVSGEGAIYYAFGYDKAFQYNCYPGKALLVGTADYLSGIALIKFHPLGFQQWVKIAEGDGQNMVNDLSISKNDVIAIAGDYESSNLTFDNNTIDKSTSNNYSNMFVAKMQDPTRLFCAEVSTHLMSDRPYLCPLDTIQLSMQQSYGGEFKWLRNGIDQVKNDSLLRISEEGVYQLITNNLTACPDSSSTIQIIKHQRPVLEFSTSTDSTIICPNDSLILGTPFNSSYQYKWFYNSVLREELDSAIIIKSKGTYQLEVTNGYCNQVDSIKIKEISSPFLLILKDTLIYNGWPIALNPNASEASSLSWYFDNDIEEFSRDEIVTCIYPGKYLVMARNYCGIDIGNFVVMKEPKDLPPKPNPETTTEQPKVTLYPNPCVEKLEVELKGFHKGKVVYEIVDIKGHLVERKELDLAENQKSITITSVAQQASGKYFIKVVQDEKSLVEKFVVGK